ncbi:MAG: oxidoreductase [Siphonobacter sp.]
METKTALIIGASGLVGSNLIFKLLQSDRYDRVISLTRRSMHIKHSKLDERIVDFDHLTTQDFAGVNDIFCCLGTTIKKAGSQEAFRKVDFDYPLNVAKLAIAAGASQYLLVSSIGANAQSSIFYTRTKGEIEAAINALGFPSYAIFRPSTLLGKRKEFRLGEEIGKALDLLLSPITLLVPPLRRYKGIQALKVAKAMLAIASQEVPGKHIIQSDEMQYY